MREITDGIVHWTAQHPNIGQRVSSYLVVPSATLIDPLLPDEGLDGIERIVRPERIVLTNRHHVRDVPRLVDAFGCSVHVHEKGTATFSDLDVAPSTFAFGDEVAPGITALEVGSITPEETALRIDVGDGALSFADGFLNDGGRVGFMPDGLLGEDPDAVKKGLRLAATRLLDERFAHLLFAHGEPIVGDGREALQAVTVPD
ncbi:hypothetical protein [Patulibacter sp.]|uniref:hypothetical protein n=1 Tax=Patulibacter sp. TaxID=1912859 RepID=UPI00272484B4|nr:hypothetical protein [Patulibacter sp.]MDO9410418.1 hypothetical protein [Patulibacter sp.]